MYKDPKLHFSGLKHIDKTELHFRHNELHEREDTDDFLIGRATHAIVLQDIQPKHWDGRRAGKAYEEAVAENDGEDLLNATQYNLVMRMAESVSNSRLAQDILRRCPIRERAIEFERRGFDCAGRVDAYGQEDQAELKTDKSVAPYRFKKTAHWNRYPEQMCWYDEGLGTKFDGEYTKFRNNYIIAVEKVGPVYPVAVFRITPLRLLQAHDRIEGWLDRLERSRREKFYPGWDGSVHDIDCEIITNGEEEELLE